MRHLLPTGGCATGFRPDQVGEKPPWEALHPTIREGVRDRLGGTTRASWLSENLDSRRFSRRRRRGLEPKVAAQRQRWGSAPRIATANRHNSEDLAKWHTARCRWHRAWRPARMRCANCQYRWVQIAWGLVCQGFHPRLIAWFPFGERRPRRVLGSAGACTNRLAPPRMS